MVFDIKGKIALVTGAAQGIGLAYCKELLKNGLAGVVIADIEVKKGTEVVANLNKEYGSGKAVFVKTDVTKEVELENAYKVAIAEFKGLDLVMNNAGILKDSLLDLEIDINCTALTKSSLLAMKYMGKNNGGRGGVVVNISSIAGLDEMFFCPIYVGTKHFVQSFTRCLANPFFFNLTGVEFRVICPGVTDTALISEAVKFILPGFPGLDKAANEYMKELPTQGVDNVAEIVIKVIKQGENGSVWNPEGREVYKVNIPDRMSIRTKHPL